MQIKKNEIKTLASQIMQRNDTRISISEFLEHWLINEKGISLLSCQEIIEKYVGSLKSELKHIINKHKNELTIPKYRFSSYNLDILIKSSLLVDKSQRGAIEYKIKYRDKISELLKNISWREFEILSKFILKFNGISNITITQSVNDQGLDFWGYFKNEVDVKVPRFISELNLRIVGQVKHSAKENKVNHSKISSFGTEISRLRKKLPPNYFKELPDSFFDSPLPLLGVFITNSLYLPKAESFSIDYGIIIWNGNQFSEDLSNVEFSNKIIDSDGELSLENLKSLLNEL